MMVKLPFVMHMKGGGGGGDQFFIKPVCVR